MKAILQHSLLQCVNVIEQHVRTIKRTELGIRSRAVQVHLHIDVDAIVDEQLEAQHAAGRRCGQVQRRAAVVVGLSDISATVDQLGGHCVVAIQAGHVESCVAENVCVVCLQVKRRRKKTISGKSQTIDNNSKCQ